MMRVSDAKIWSWCKFKMISLTWMMHPLTGVKTLPFGRKHWVECDAERRRKMAPCLRLHNKNLSGKVAQFWDNWTIFSARLKIDIPGGNSASVETTRALNLHRRSKSIFDHIHVQFKLKQWLFNMVIYFFKGQWNYPYKTYRFVVNKAIDVLN